VLPNLAVSSSFDLVGLRTVLEKFWVLSPSMLRLPQLFSFPSTFFVFRLHFSLTMLSISCCMFLTLCCLWLFTDEPDSILFDDSCLVKDLSTCTLFCSCSFLFKCSHYYCSLSSLDFH
jgi:hypothetical protein